MSHVKLLLITRFLYLIINEFDKNNINVLEILSKRNKLEELFIELTQSP